MDKCKCVDCYGTEPGHDPDCEYMNELHREQPEKPTPACGCDPLCPDGNCG